MAFRAKSILTVCLFCLLHADHLACQQHGDSNDIEISNMPPIYLNYDHTKNDMNFNTLVNQNNYKTKNKNNNDHSYNNNNDNKKEQLTIKDLENHPRFQQNSYDNLDSKYTDNNNNKNNKNNYNYYNNIYDINNPYRKRTPNSYIKLIKPDNLIRQRRHAGHDHDNEDNDNIDISPITKEFIKKIFLNYGEKGREMNLKDFEIMMDTLNLTKLKYNNITINSIDNNNNNNNDNECSSINHLFEKLYPEVKENLQNEYNELVRENPELAKQYQVADPVYKLTKNNIHSMCPIILYQLLSPNLNEKQGCIQNKNLNVIETKHTHPEVYEKDHFLIWTYSTLAVVICGLLGLVGIAIIPFMNTKFYQQILSFLVALAIGTMTGDALLHLIPHSVICATEEQMVRKGLVCVSGIIGFYLVENSFTLISEYRKKSRRKANSNRSVPVFREQGKTANHTEDGAGDKLCKSKYSTDYCYDEVTGENKDDIGQQNSHQENRGDGVHVNHENDRPLPVSVILREHDHTHHGHAHKHGHVHSPPSTISAVAWMIILGDGLHNFTDGMAIGAAFSESIPGGFSTSLAVFCHELPHELGDFAILIKAGMTPKAAVAYNCLTAILSFVGMIFGIVFGENDDASRWMFSVAAGLFIYIALVDMMPEMTSAHNTVQQIFLQLLGLVGGLMSMLLIAIYEHELMNIFGGHNHSHACPSNGHSHGGGHGHSH
ncbi:zinc transporter foi [Condylostylus longicornis]|uniref:zinc transporter foi n=1 Tax=Condylostylus longicornis TaxID=2530218 RepID=UPI00244E2334|nr:zinc transporter foi [Condylostylus longicornis]XP_055385280.1 zinc transporter foi [Condylostylus longicornis]